MNTQSYEGLSREPNRDLPSIVAIQTAAKIRLPFLPPMKNNRSNEARTPLGANSGTSGSRSAMKMSRCRLNQAQQMKTRSRSRSGRFGATPLAR